MQGEWSVDWSVDWLVGWLVDGRCVAVLAAAVVIVQWGSVSIPRSYAFDDDT